MGQDATKVLLGSTESSDRRATSTFSADPATFKAGLAVRIDSTGALSLAKADGRWVGISLGRNLSDSKKTTVLRTGSLVPILVSSEPARGLVTITNVSNLLATTPDSITIGATVFTAQSSAVTPGDTTFQAVTDVTTTAASLVAQINAHATAGALVVASNIAGAVTITAKLNTTAGNAIALAYTDNHATSIGATVSGAFLTGGGSAADYVVLGAKVYIADETGMADDPKSLATISDAIYASGVLTGVDEDGNSAACALVDMVGGL